jgi:drug/metabolite transporter (DMT)-like permease
MMPGRMPGIVAALGAPTASGLALAAAAAACYETGYAFQALEARRVPARYALRASLLTWLLRNGRWLAATGLSLLGWPLQVAALALAPLALVQPTLALGLVLLLALGVRVLHEPVGRRELAAVALVIAGLAAVAACAPGRVDGTFGTGLGIAIAVLAGLALAPYLDRTRRAGLPAVLSAGAADAVAALAAKVVAGELGAGRWAVAAGFVLVAALAALLATVSEMSALQRLPATRVAPIVLVVQIVVPVAVAGLLGGESWGATPLGGLALGAGLAAAVGGAVLLASSRPVGAVMRPAPAPGPPTPRS